MSFRQAAARFLADVDYALTRARRAARDARAEAAEFRERTDELFAQAKSGKLRGLRRGQVAPTDPAAQADAAKFRTDNGLPVPDLPTAEQLMAGLPGRAPRPRPSENDDFVNAQVLFDVDKEPREPRQPPEQEPSDPPLPESTRTSDREDDFSQQRILFDATEGTYRPDDLQASVFDLDEPDNRR
jgi:hypothetical protein